MHRLSISSLAVFALMALLTAPAAFAATNDTITVTVNVSSVAELTVLPSSLSWTAGNLGAVSPGTNSPESNIIIKNTGSVNLTSIYLNASTLAEESANPLSTPNASAYSSAGFIMVRNSTNGTYVHAGRLEWNLSSILTNETLNIGPTVTNYSHGWYRNSSGSDYLWKLENGTVTGGPGNCSASNAAFTIKTIPETSTTMSRNLADGNTVTCTNTAGGSDWAVFDCNSGPLGGSCVAAHYTCTKIYIYKYNYDTSQFPACSNRRYVDSTALIPGAETSMTLFAAVPKGTPSGTAMQGTLTLLATG